MKEVTKHYTNGEVTVVWKNGLCIHSAICIRGLPQVFDVNASPWVNINGASTEQIIAQVKKCPSGALSYFMNAEVKEGEEVKVDAETIVETLKDGPLMVYGNVRIKDSNGQLTQKSNATAFCRCGASGNKPFCDGTHRKIGFKAD